MKLIRGVCAAASHDACPPFHFTSRNSIKSWGAPEKTGAKTGAVRRMPVTISSLSATRCRSQTNRVPHSRRRGTADSWCAPGKVLLVVMRMCNTSGMSRQMGQLDARPGKPVSWVEGVDVPGHSVRMRVVAWESDLSPFDRSRSLISASRA